MVCLVQHPRGLGLCHLFVFCVRVGFPFLYKGICWGEAQTLESRGMYCVEAIEEFLVCVAEGVV